jgi:hypothetical protein
MLGHLQSTASELDSPCEPPLLLPAERNDCIYIRPELLDEGGLDRACTATPGLRVANLKIEGTTIETFDQCIRK